MTSGDGRGAAGPVVLNGSEAGNGGRGRSNRPGAAEDRPAGCLAAAIAPDLDDNRGSKKNFHRTQATSALNAIIRDITVHLRTNAFAPLSAPCDDTPTANATISSTPKNVTAALINASNRVRFIRLSKRRQAG
jgi:hypothetical protein